MVEQNKTIPVTRIIRSTTNPRTIFDEAKLKELANSMLQKGQLEAITVRPVDDNFELVDGERRYRAAKIAGLKELKAVVLDITVEEAAERQLISFVQREDIGPFEEADAYHKVIELHAKKQPKAKEGEPPRDLVAELSLRFGKPKSHVVKILKLSKLIEPAKKMLIDKRIDLEGAMHIARLSQEYQKELCSHLSGELTYRAFIKAKEISEVIARSILLDIHVAPFDPKDETLLLKAGSCIACPKRTGNAPDLFGDIKNKQTCTDGACFGAKIEAHIARTEEEYKAKGTPLLRLARSYNDDKKLDAIGTSGYVVVPKKEAKVFGIRVDPRDEALGKIVGVRLTDSAPAKAKAEAGETVKKEPPTYERRMELYKRRIEIFDNRVQQEARETVIMALLRRIKWPLDIKEFRILLPELLALVGFEPRESFIEIVRAATGIKKVGALEDWSTAIEKMIPKLTDQQCAQIAFACVLQQELIVDPTMSRLEFRRFEALLAVHPKADWKGALEAAEEKLAPKKPKKVTKRTGRGKGKKK